MLKDPVYLNHFMKGRSSDLLILDGIGDFFVLETFMSDDMRRHLSKVFYASRVQHFIAKLWQSLPNFPNLKDHVFLWTDWDRVYCWLKKINLRNDARFLRANPKLDLRPIREYTWSTFFPRYSPKMCSQSSFLKYNVANLNNFTFGDLLPENYYCICPSSPYNRRWNAGTHGNARHFGPKEWDSLHAFLSKRDSFGVVVNIGEDHVPSHPRIINLTNKTTLSESIEILKKAQGYVGVDSCLSVLAARHFDLENLFVKSNNSHCYRWKHVYYHPQTNFTFLRRNLLGIQ